MANYCIMRFQKHKKESIAKVERHQNDREHLKNRAHPERKNKTIKRYQDETMLQTVKRLQKEQEIRTGRKVRKDAVALVEIVLTFSPEAEEHIARNFKEWYRKNMQWVKDTFGDDNLIRCDINRDQETLHLHTFIVPLDEKGNFNAKRWFGKKEQLERLQDSYAEYMAEFGLERGLSKNITKAIHQTKQQYERKMAKLIDDIFDDKPTLPKVEPARNSIADEILR